MHEVLTKSAFASRVGVSRPRVSQWLAERQIYGDAIVGTGNRARIRVPIALDQLKQTLDVDQRLTDNARAKLDPVAWVGDEAVPQTVEARIKAERLEQLVLGNDKLREEAASRNGVFCLSADVRQSEGRLAARLLTIVEAGLTDMADALSLPRAPWPLGTPCARYKGPGGP